MKKPKTIADLKIIWTFIEDEGNITICNTLTYKLFKELNPNIHALTIKPDSYIIRFRNQDYDVMSYNSESLAGYMTYLNYIIWSKFEESIILDRFEQISLRIYILHEKNPA